MATAAATARSGCSAGAALLQWPPEGDLNNPQLDVDHIGDLPGPENINVTRAAAGMQFVVGVHYSGGEPTGTVVRVYCGGCWCSRASG